MGNSNILAPAKPRTSCHSQRYLNPCGSHSPPLAALIARVSETDVLLSTGRRLAHLYNILALGSGILYVWFRVGGSGMPRPYSTHLRQRVLRACELGRLSRARIAALFG